MSCKSPFTYSISVGEGIETQYSYSGSDSVSVPGYSIPPVTTCTLELQTPAHTNWVACTKYGGCAKTQCGSCKACSWGGWRNSLLQCGWNVCNCNTWWDSHCTSWTGTCADGWVHGQWGWCCCKTSQAIPVFPTLTAAFDFTLNMGLYADTAVVFSITGATPVVVAGVTIINATLGLNVSADNTNVFSVSFDSEQLGLDGIQLETKNGEFEGIVPLTSLTYNHSYFGYDFDVTIASNLLFCFPSTVSVINVQFTITYTITQNENQITSQTLGLAIPLVVPE